MSRRLLAFLARLRSPWRGCSVQPRRVVGLERRATAAGGRHRRRSSVTLTDDGCEPRSLSASAGPTTFKVTQQRLGGVTEFEVLDGEPHPRRGRERGPGLTGDFTLTLKPGSYTTNCPGGGEVDEGHPGGRRARHRRTPPTRPTATAAVATYLTYVKGEADQLGDQPAPFAAAVKAGDMAKAKTLFAAGPCPLRGDRADRRELRRPRPRDRRPRGRRARRRSGAASTASRRRCGRTTLDRHGPGRRQAASPTSTELQHPDRHVQLEPAQIANGAVELLNEVSTSQDHRRGGPLHATPTCPTSPPTSPASKAAFEALQAAARLRADRPDAVSSSSASPTCRPALDKYKGTDPIGNGYVLYTTLTPDQDPHAVDHGRHPGRAAVQGRRAAAVSHGLSTQAEDLTPSAF